MIEVAARGAFPRAAVGLSDDSGSVSALVLTILGGTFVLFDGVILFFTSAVADAYGLYQAGGFYGAIGFLALLIGLGLIGLGVRAYQRPESHVGYGITIIGVSLLSLATGGGFIIGAILGTIGGILAIVFQPENEYNESTFCPRCLYRNPALTARCARCGEPLAPANQWTG